MEPSFGGTAIFRHEALLQRAMQGDREAIGEVFAPHIPRLYRTSYKILKNQHDAEDAVQDGLLSALRNMNAFEGRSQFPTWLTRIVVNAALMQIRRTRSRKEISIDQPDGPYEESLVNSIPDCSPNPEELYTEQQRRESVTRCIRASQPPGQNALWLRHIHGLKVREIAEILGLSTGSVKSQLHRARVRLKKEIVQVPQRESASAAS